jgi:hypothetical protein
VSKDCLNVANVNKMNTAFSKNMETQNVSPDETTQKVETRFAANVSPKNLDTQNVYISSSVWPKTVNINRDAHLAEMEGIRLDQGMAMPLYLAAYVTNEGDAKFRGEFLWSTICFEVDTGCDRTIMSVKKCKEHDLIMRVF